jgi:DNA polymerase-1
MDSLYLVDGSNLLFRAFHAMPQMSTKSGIPTGAVRGFVNMLLRLIAEERPSHLAVVFDAGGRDKRAELFAEYKQNRGECPPELVPQFDLARRLVRAIGIAVLDATDAEADDLIATLAERAHKTGLKVVIVSSDKDLMQLVSDGHVELLDTMKEEGRGKVFDEKAVVEKWGVPPAQLGDVLALMGDSSDNVPGVPGVGPKTAAQLIASFGSLDKLLQTLADKGDLGDAPLRGKDKLALALREHRERILLNRQLVTLDMEVPLTLELAELSRRQVARDELLALLNELEFTTLLRRLTAPGGLPGMPDLSELTGPAAPSPAVPASPEKAAPTVVPLATAEATTDVLLTLEQLRMFIDRAQSGPALSVVPVLCGSAHKPQNPRLAPLAGVAFFTPAAPSAYLPLAHRYLGAPAQLPVAQAFELLNPLLGNAALKKAVYNAKDAYLVLDRHGAKLAGVYSDPALCSYLVDPALAHDLGSLITRYLPADYPPPESRQALCQAGKHAISFDEVDLIRAAACVTAEARAIFHLAEVFEKGNHLDAAAQRLLSTLELPLSRVLATVEQYGVLIDVSVLERLSKETEARLRTLEAELENQTGARINLNSPRQLAELLFEKLGLPPVKKTRGKTGQSVDAEVLEALAAEHESARPIIRAIIEHRSLSKLKGTYMDQFPLLCDKQSGRLHTSFQQVVAATGRLSSTEPNLQNIPIRSEIGQEIRRAFIAPPGSLLIAADYSQIELRVLAHLSSDALLTDSFRKGEDVHARTAVEMFGEVEGRTSDKRRAAKMINYGIIYGLSDYGLATRLGIARGVAKEYIREYFLRYRGVRDFMEELVLRARRDGGARTLLGRFRPLPELTAQNYAVRSYAERMAKNTPLQGTAADILKQAMIEVQAELSAHPDEAGRMLLTVHDELVIEAPAERAEAVAQRVRVTMERAAELSVPLKVDVGVAHSWADC